VRHRERRERVLAAVGHPVLVTEPTNVRYLTGFTGSNGQLLLDDPSFFFTDGRYATQSSEQVPDCERVLYEQNTSFVPRLGEILSASGIGELGLEASHVTVQALRTLTDGLPGVRLVETTRSVERVRMLKEPEEVELIRRAQVIAESALTGVMQRWQGGTELDLALELEWAVRTSGADAVSFEVIVASGPRSALPHARPSRERIDPDAVLLVDMGARVQGYCSDMTRTWTNRAPDPMRDVHAAVVEALEAALAVLRPGVLAADVDREAREVLSRAGYGEAFVHSTGHSLGLDIHEQPRLAGGSQTVLEEGMVLTVEPGAYLPGLGGVRVEDLVLVTSDGYENLTSLPRQPV